MSSPKMENGGLLLPLKAVGWGPFGLTTKGLALCDCRQVDRTIKLSQEAGSNKKKRGLEVHGGYADDLLQRTCL